MDVWKPVQINVINKRMLKSLLIKKEHILYRKKVAFFKTTTRIILDFWYDALPQKVRCRVNH